MVKPSESNKNTNRKRSRDDCDSNEINNSNETNDLNENKGKKIKTDDDNKIEDEIMYLVTHFQCFYEPFIKYVKDINEDDYTTLEKELEFGGKNKDWEKGGKLNILMTDMIKKYFSVKVGLIPWSVPYCCGGVFLILEADKKTLEDVAKTLKMESEGENKVYEITDQNGAENDLFSLIC